MQAGRKHRRLARFRRRGSGPLGAPFQRSRCCHVFYGSEAAFTSDWWGMGHRAHMSQKGLLATTSAFPMVGPPDDRWLRCRFWTRVCLPFAATRVRPHSMVSVGSSPQGHVGLDLIISVDPLVCGAWPDCIKCVEIWVCQGQNRDFICC